MKDYLNIVKSAVSKISKVSPVLLIGDASVCFEKLYSGPMKEVFNSDDVRELVTYYYGVEHLSHPLVIKDLGSLSEEASFLLLKLVEEAKYPIILLSSYDKVSPILLSRCRKILKFSMTDISSDFLPAFVGKSAMDEYLAEGSDKMDQLKWMRDHSPMLYYYYTTVGKTSNIDKMLNLLM